MKNESMKLTTSQFAKLHNVNKRTLHYYDSIGLFSPRHIGDNKYRYYDCSQGMEFECIRMLKEINMSIEEIKQFVHSFDEQKFLQTAERKQKEINEEIRKLERVKTVLAQKQEHVLLCENITDMELQTVELKAEYLLTVPYRFEENGFMEVFQYIQKMWSPEQYRAGVGSYISLDKVKAGVFQEYDGLYSPVVGEGEHEGLMRKPQGKYLCGYLKGSWSRLPDLYRKMLHYAVVQKCTDRLCF